MNFQLLVLRPEHHVLSSMAPEWDSYEWWRTEWLCVFLLPASLISTPCQYRSISLQRPGLCCYFFLKLCACTSGEVQRAFEDAIQFPTHTSTVVCLLLFLAKRRGGFSLKAWSFSCFCVITEHKVKSPPSRCLSQSLTFHYFFVGVYSVFPGTKRLLLIRSLPFLMSPRNGSFFIFEVFHRSVLWKKDAHFLPGRLAAVHSSLDLSRSNVTVKICLSQRCAGVSSFSRCPKTMCLDSSAKVPRRKRSRWMAGSKYCYSLPVSDQNPNQIFPHKYDRETLTPCLLQEDFQALTDFLKHGRAQK